MMKEMIPLNIRFYQGKLRWVINERDYDFFMVAKALYNYRFKIHDCSIEKNFNNNTIVYDGILPLIAGSANINLFFAPSFMDRMIASLPKEQRKDAIRSWHMYYNTPSLWPDTPKFYYCMKGYKPVFKEESHNKFHVEKLNDPTYDFDNYYMKHYGC